jgi:hypothetical protein
MTLEQLRKYDGTSAESEGRICVAVNGKIFDVSRVSSVLDPDSLDPPYPGLLRNSDPDCGSSPLLVWILIQTKSFHETFF